MYDDYTFMGKRVHFTQTIFCRKTGDKLTSGSSWSLTDNVNYTQHFRRDWEDEEKELCKADARGWGRRRDMLHTNQTLESCTKKQGKQVVVTLQLTDYTVEWKQD